MKPSSRVSEQRLAEQKHGTSTLDLLERILSPENLQQAWSRVKANFVEAKLRLVVNHQKSKTAHLSDCTFLRFQIRREKIMWTDKALKRFKERVQEITGRSRGVSMRARLSQLRRYVVGWLNYFGISQAYREIPELDQWLRRRVRLCYWKQWKRSRTRRRHLIRLGIHPAAVYKATRSHRGYWFMAATSIVQRALDNRWLAEQGVPNMEKQWIEMHYGKVNEKFNPAAANLVLRCFRWNEGSAKVVGCP